MPPLWQLIHDARTLDWLTALVEEAHHCRVWRQGSGEKRDEATRAAPPAGPVAPSAAADAGTHAGATRSHGKVAGARAR